MFKVFIRIANIAMFSVVSRLVSVACIIIIILMTTQAAYAQRMDGQPSFSLQPTTYDPAIPATKSYFVLNGESNVTLQESVQVVNSGTSTGSVLIYPVTATTGDSGGAVYLAKQDSLRDAAAWIVLPDKKLTLAPGQSQDIPFLINVPNLVHAGQHFGGIAAENLTPMTSKSGQLHFNVVTRTVIPVEINVPGPQVEQMAVTGAKAGGSNGYQSIVLSMANAGNIILKPTGELKVSNSQGQLLQDISFKMGTFLPDTSINDTINVQKKALAAGSYPLSLVLHYGHGKILNYNTTLTISQSQINQVFQPSAPLQAPNSVSSLNAMPLWQIILVTFAGGIILIVIGRWLYKLIFGRRRHRQARGSHKKADEAAEGKKSKAA